MLQLPISCFDDDQMLIVFKLQLKVRGWSSLNFMIGCCLDRTISYESIQIIYEISPHYEGVQLGFERLIALLGDSKEQFKL
eukprot:403340810